MKTPTATTAQREMATRIAKALFTNGSGERAKRLVLTIDGPPVRDLGGWGLLPAIDAIARVLAEAQSVEAST